MLAVMIVVIIIKVPTAMLELLDQIAASYFIELCLFARSVRCDCPMRAFGFVFVLSRSLTKDLTDLEGWRVSGYFDLVVAVLRSFVFYCTF